ncbi:MAG: putative nucleoside transporter YegT [Verrucomicrobiota bacterium]|jgi:nucleoside transporter
MNPVARIQISLLFFIQFFIWGTWGVSMGTWMTGLGFTPTQIGTAFGATSVAAMISPFLVGAIADRFFAAQRVLGFLHLLGGVLLYLASRTTTFSAFYALLIAHTLCYMPTLALVNTVAFSQMTDSSKSFGGIRVMGTFGWIAAGMLIGKLNLGNSPTQFVIGAALSVVLGLYCCWVLPEVPPKAKGQAVSFRGILGLDALQLFRDSSFAVFAVGSFLICIPLAFYYSGTERFLTQIGVAEAPAKMTFGQMSEVLFMIIFPLLFARLGVKKMLVLGMACWLVRYLCFAYGNATTGLWMLMAGILLHGPCFDFFFVTGQIYVDQKAPEHLRSAAQCLIAFLTYGAGMLVGSLAQGKIISMYTLPDSTVHWTPTWVIPAVGSGVIMLAFMALFRAAPPQPAREERSTAPSVR